MLEVGVTQGVTFLLFLILPFAFHYEDHIPGQGNIFPCCAIPDEDISVPLVYIGLNMSIFFLIIIFCVNSQVTQTQASHDLLFKKFMDHEYLCKILQLTHRLLNSSNPNLAKNCWLYLSTFYVLYSAILVPTCYCVSSNMTFHPKYQGGCPFQLIGINDLFSFQITDMTTFSFTGQAVELLKFYHLNLTHPTSPQFPILGLISMYTSLKF